MICHRLVPGKSLMGYHQQRQMNMNSALEEGGPPQTHKTRVWESADMYG